MQSAWRSGGAAAAVAALLVVSLNVGLIQKVAAEGSRLASPLAPPHPPPDPTPLNSHISQSLAPTDSGFGWDMGESATPNPNPNPSVVIIIAAYLTVVASAGGLSCGLGELCVQEQQQQQQQRQDDVARYDKSHLG